MQHEPFPNSSSSSSSSTGHGEEEWVLPSPPLSTAGLTAERQELERGDEQQELRLEGCFPSQMAPLEAAPPPTADAPAAAPTMVPPPPPPAPLPPPSPSSDYAAAAEQLDAAIGAGVLRMAARPAPLHINLLVWGEAGLGKTTLISNLVRGWLPIKPDASSTATPRPDPPPLAAAAPRSPQAAAGPAVTPRVPGSPAGWTTVALEPVPDAAGTTELHITLHEAPGWGGPTQGPLDLLPGLQSVLEFAAAQRAADLATTQAGLSASCAVPGALMQRGLTACVYLLPPGQLRLTDCLLAEALSQVVTLVPVVSKADSLTPLELQAFKARAAQALGGHAFSFSKTHLAALHAPGARMPLAVVAASTPTDSPDSSSSSSSLHGAPQTLAQQQPCRRYAFGTALPHCRAHSELLLLRALLFGHSNAAVHDLLGESWRRAHAYAAQAERAAQVSARGGGGDGGGSAGGDAVVSSAQLLAGRFLAAPSSVAGSAGRTLAEMLAGEGGTAAGGAAATGSAAAADAVQTSEEQRAAAAHEGAAREAAAAAAALAATTNGAEQLAAERTAVAAERDAAVAERTTALAERDAAMAERAAGVAERDAAVVSQARHAARTRELEVRLQYIMASLSSLQSCFESTGLQPALAEGPNKLCMELLAMGRKRFWGFTTKLWNAMDGLQQITRRVADDA